MEHIETIQGKNVKVRDDIFEDVLAALYDQDVAFTKLKRISTEYLSFGGVRDQ